MNIRSRKFVLLLVLLLIVGAVPVYFATSDNPFIKIIRFTRLNAFEFEGEEIGGIKKDIVYKTVDGESLMVDLYMPFERKHSLIPVLAYSHGGGWVIGDRDTMLVGPDNKGLIIRLRELGYAIANFEFRLINENVTVYDAIADNKDMIRWLRKNAGEYELDPDNIGIWGQSGGGQLALLVGLSDEKDFVGDKMLRDVSAQVKYVVNHYGSGDMELTYGDIATGKRDPYFHETMMLKHMFETWIDEDPEAFLEGLRTIDPVNYIGGGDAPVITVHGELDDGASPDISTRLHRELDAESSGNELHIIKDVGHIFMGGTPEQIEAIVDVTVDFIVRNTIAES